MTRECFVPKTFNAEHERIIEHANELLEDAHAGGFAITLRSLYYQFIGEEVWFPNTIQSYKRLGGIIAAARLAGLIDWDLIEDGMRETVRVDTWRNPESIMDSVVLGYKEDLWVGQERRIHLRVEKHTLVGVIAPACERWRVPYTACRGNTSLTEAYQAGKELGRQVAAGLHPLVLYMGDHDPSGIDMTRDNEERLSMFARRGIEVRRIALNYDQIEQHHLPGNPAKETDSRHAAYKALFGEESWEMEALKPRTVDQILEEAISSVIDLDLWNDRAAAEQLNIDTLTAVRDRWDEVVETFGGDDA